MSTSAATSTPPSPSAVAPRRGAGRRLTGAVRRIPSAAWACALVAVLNCVAWSLITPAFQVPDEPDHYAYVEQLATAVRPPANDAAAISRFSSSEQAALVGLGTERVHFHAYVPSITTQAQQAALMDSLDARPSRSDGNGVSLAGSPQPPLYYALQLPAYAVGAVDTPLLSLQLMRLFSALLGGVTVLCVFLFVREALPAHPWTWAVGALGVAFQPLFAFISGGVNPDALLFATASALFLCLARGFRRGLTTRLAIASGAVMAAGLLTKLNFAGLLPGALAGLVVLGVRSEDGWSVRALRRPAIALGVAAVPFVAMVLANVLVWDRDPTGATTGVFRPSTEGSSLGGALAYLVQLYLVHVPGTVRRIPESFAVREVWVRGFVGWYGWVDTAFRSWVYTLGTGVLGVLAALAGVSLVRARAVVRRRLAELLAYAAMAGGLLVVVGVNSYNLWLQHAGGGGQTRYLLPLVALYAAVLVLAARAFGRRWTPLIGVAIVLLTLADDVFSQLLVIARYYA
jgi:4-amino-4-deoxy-L-arabinose transferase-like glycosyltransferase